MRNRRVLVLGSTGLLGSGVADELERRAWEVINASRLDFDAQDPGSLAPLLSEVNPSLVVNCTGIVDRVTDLHSTVRVNSLFPLIASRLCMKRDLLFVHVSTDAVFSGKKGSYEVGDIPDPVDDYGITKLLGEGLASGVVIRTSIIGRAGIYARRSLLDWAVESEESELAGFTNQIWSGMTTLELGRLLDENLKSVSGARPPTTVHAAGASMSKYELLVAITKVFGTGKRVVPREAESIDRSLIATPSWVARRDIETQLAVLRDASTRH